MDPCHKRLEQPFIWFYGLEVDIKMIITMMMLYSVLTDKPHAADTEEICDIMQHLLEMLPTGNISYQSYLI